MKISPYVVFLLMIFPFFMKGERASIYLSTLPDSAIDLNPQLEIFTDETNLMSWEEAYQLYKKNKFQPFQGYPFKSVLERGKYSYWLYFSIDYLSDEAEQVIIRGTGGDSLMFYQIHEERLIDQKNAGTLISTKDTAEIAYWRWDMPFRLTKGKTEILIRYRCFPTHHLSGKNIKLLKEDLAITSQEKGIMAHYTFFGLFIGVVLFMFLFSLLQYYQNRDKTFLFYAIFIGSVFIYFWRYYALNTPYFRLLPDWMLATEYFTLLNIPMYITYGLFLKAFVGDDPKFSKLQWAINLFLGIILAYILIERAALYFSLNWAYRVEKIGKPIFLIIGIFILGSFWFTKNRGPINYLLFGTFLMLALVLLGEVITIDSERIWNEFNIPNTISQIGILISLLCFSLGLGAKTKLVEIEKNQTQLALQLQQKEAQQLKELDEYKARFYTNISHELRTPLTIIKGLTKQINNNPTIQLEERLAIVERNTDQLKNLVDQVLDISKLEAGGAPITTYQGDIIRYVRYLVESFHSLALDKKINLSFYTKDQALMVDFDKDKLQKIVNNLILNAIKFTPAYGRILLTVQQYEYILNSLPSQRKFHQINPFKTDTPYFKINIKDSGKGMPSDKLPLIFDRYYQAESNDNASLGTGIGLALTKELVTLLDGVIQVESELGKGSTFSVYLPITNDAALDQFDQQEIVFNEASFQQDLEVLPTPSVKDARPILLIVEDHSDVIYYLKTCVRKRYQVIEATNGKEGLAKAIKEIPDIIISDIMMPEMDGYELSAALQNDIRTSHIPFLLLTAKATQESKRKGLATGALAYLTKPFDPEELLIRLQRLLEWKKQLQTYLKQKDIEKKTITNNDPLFLNKEVVFLERVNHHILDQLDNENFRAPQLARAMAMSESQLYRKLKATTDQSIAKYLQSIRLKKAYQFLNTTNFTIGEVAHKVGFKQTSHFTKAFKDYFGCLPSEIEKIKLS